MSIEEGVMAGETATEPVLSESPAVEVDVGEGEERDEGKKEMDTDPVEVDTQMEEKKEEESPSVEGYPQTDREPTPTMESDLESDKRQQEEEDADAEIPAVKVDSHSDDDEDAPSVVNSQIEEDQRETPAVKVEAQSDKEATPPVQAAPQPEENEQDTQTPASTDSMVTVSLSTDLPTSGQSTPNRRESSVPEEWLMTDKRASTSSVTQDEKGKDGEETEKQADDDDDDDDKPSEGGTIVWASRKSTSEDSVYSERRNSADMFTPDDQPSSTRASMALSRTSSRTSKNSLSSDGGDKTPDADKLDWVELEKTEEQESKADPDDEATALLLAKLEQENNALATDPKSNISRDSQAKRKSRPPSVQHIRNLVNETDHSSLSLSELPAPQMTELEFWAALVADYPRTAQKLPTLTSNKIRAGVPPPLRGVVWPSIAGARDTALHEEFEQLCNETSPYEGIIGKDIGRSWPNVDMFKDPNGEGQQMLARVLKCFSLHDSKIGYCQGLGFVVGPLLMHMSEAEAFCVLVRLMDHYDLRSCFQPTLSGLHLRIYQFQTLLSRHLPKLHSHLEELKIEPVYVSQWFLSFFAVTCPLPMLLRIYDVLLLEGACETLMRVALSLMQRNEQKLLECHEIEDVMQLLLSRSLWDTYSCNADDLVADFVSLTSLVTRESLQAIEAGYKDSHETAPGISFPQLQTVASRFLGRLWAGSSASSTKSLATASPQPGATQPGTPSSPSVTGTVRRTPSKQSMASTLNSFESTSETSTLATEVSSQDSKRKLKQQNKDSNLHSQIEDLLVALTDMQREQAALAKELQKEREEREEDQKLAALLVGYIREQSAEDNGAEELLAKAARRFSSSRSSKRLSSMQTKQQLREDITMWKEKYEIEAARCQNLGRSMDEHEQQETKLKEELQETQSRLQESFDEKQQLEQTIEELRSSTSPSSTGSETGSSSSSTTTTPAAATSTDTFTKRSSSLGAPTVINTESYEKADEDSMLVELVNAKTAEAVARQELDEVKAKLEATKKTLAQAQAQAEASAAAAAAAATTCSSCSSTTTASSSTADGGGNTNVNVSTAANSSTHTNSPSSASSASAALSSAGTFFTSWTRRNPSTTTVVESK